MDPATHTPAAVDSCHEREAMRRSEAVSETRHFANLIINSVEEWQDHVAERPCPAFAAILLVATCHAVNSEPQSVLYI